mgnify:CR=1 FL=1
MPLLWKAGGKYTIGENRDSEIQECIPVTRTSNAPPTHDEGPRLAPGPSFPGPAVLPTVPVALAARNPVTHLLHREAGGHSARYDGTPYNATVRTGGLLCAPDRESWQALPAASQCSVCVSA